jgi:hypothetical protein
VLAWYACDIDINIRWDSVSGWIIKSNPYGTHYNIGSDYDSDQILKY